jgi:GT2 family glycosyltransferase
MNARADPVAEQKPLSDGVTEPITLSVIIPTYNARELLANCLRSIYQNSPSEPYEVIVVDDASADGTSAMVRAHFPEVRLLRNDVNRHYASSNNRAIAQARGQYVYLLNNDTIVLARAIDSMLAFLREHPDAGAVGSKLLNEDGTVQWSVKSLPSPGSALFGARSIFTLIFPNNRQSRKHLLHLGRKLDQPFIAGYVSSASIMIPRKVFEEVGELDWRLSYHVDADYCKRIADAGYSCYYLPSATVIHFDHKGGTMVSLRRRFRSLVEFHLGSYIFYQKHIQRSRWTPMQIIVVVGIFSRFLLSLMTRAFAELSYITIALVGNNGSLRGQEPTGTTGDLAVWRAAPPGAPARKPTADC